MSEWFGGVRTRETAQRTCKCSRFVEDGVEDEVACSLQRNAGGVASKRMALWEKKHPRRQNKRTQQTAPKTTEVTKVPAPKSSPMASEPPASVFVLTIPAYTEKMSGAPLPSARKVTPATLSDSPRLVEMTASDGQKKSSAVVPSATKRTRSQMMRITIDPPGVFSLSSQNGSRK